MQPSHAFRYRQSNVPALAASVNPAGTGGPPTPKAGGKTERPHDVVVGPMGGTRLELVTSTMSTWRSNQLS